ANTSIGNTGIGATTISLNAGTTGNIVLGGVDAEVAPTEILTITATNEVRRSTLSGTAQEGLVFTAGAYRLGGTNATTNPFLTNRFVNIDASNLSFTSNGGASTTMLLTGGANSGVTMTTAGTGTITMTGPTNVTGATTINTTGTANTTIGNTGVGATTITLNAGTTGDIVLGGVDADATPTELLTITAGGQVRRSTMSGTAQEGLVFTSGAYRLGGAANTDNPLLADRFVNVDASDLSFTANGGAEVPLVVTGGAASGVILTASAAGNIVLNGVDVGVAATDFLTIDASNNVRRSPIAGIAQEGIVFTTGAYRLGGTANTDNPFLTNRFVNIDASNLSFTSDGGASTTMLLTGGANSGVAMTTAGTGTITMTGPTDVTGATTINTTGTANTTIGNTGVGATTVTLNAGATGNIVLGGVDTEATPTEILTITATNEVRRSTLSGTAQEGIVFTSGAYRLGGAANTDNPLLTDRFVNVDASDLSFTANGGAEVPLVVTGGAASGVILTASAAGNIVLNGVDVGVAATDFLTIDASNNVRRSPIAGSAQEGIVYTTNAYRLGGAANTDSPFLTNRFVNIDASNLSFTSDGGANTTLLLTGGANSAVTITPSGTGIFTVSGTPGVENIRAGSLSAVSADPIVAEGIVTADNSGDVRRRSTADALQILGIGRGIFTPAGASASHVISTGTFDLIAGATINVTVFGPTGAAVHAMVTNVDAGANQITVVTSATVDATFSLHWMIINP
ncbi:MAG TPA: hypothetical protein VK147_04450, partial [Candidatus Didemnitutus sp.]|nr:hypothetical protein [Candidatus Didemnitutus sp.]